MRMRAHDMSGHTCATQLEYARTVTPNGSARAGSGTAREWFGVFRTTTAH